MNLHLSEKIQLSPIVEKDTDLLFELMENIYKEAYQDFWQDRGDWYLNLIYNKENIKKEISRERTHYFFVSWENERVGILKYDFPFSPREIHIPNAMKLHRLYLSSRTHGQGVAKALMIHIEQVAKNNQLDSIWLEAMVSKAQAKRFYEKCGYQKIFEYRLDFEKLKDEYRQIQIMKKDLNISEYPQ